MDNAATRTDAKSVSRSIASFAAGASLSQVPSEVATRARHFLLDVLGCALAARGESFARIYADAIAGLSESVSSGSGRAVIGHRMTLPMRDAAMLNGVLAHGLDFDDTHIAGITHLSVGVLPAVLALAAERSISGERALLAYLVGLEIGSRLAGAAPGLFHDRGFHPTATVGVLASAVACATLIGLTAEGIDRAQGMALSMASGTLQFVEDGAWTKRLHAGWAANAGITAALLARQPIPTPVLVYEGRFGLFQAFLGEERMHQVDLDGAIAELGTTWRLLEIGVKPFPVCHFNHACADAAIELHRRLKREGIAIERVRRIEAHMPAGVMPSVCVPVETKRTPSTEYEAKFSAPYAVAAGLLRGRLGLADLTPGAIQDAQVQELMQRIDCVADPDSTFPRHYSGEVALTLDDGTTLVQREAVNRGHPERPMEVDAIREKYRANATLWFGQDDAAALEDFVLSIEAQDDMRRIEPLLSLSLRNTD